MPSLADAKFFYNGIGLFIVKTNTFSQRAVMTSDNVDYLYTEFTIDINCIYNPGATSYDNSTPPEFSLGFNPSQTNASIRHYLMQPRKQLAFVGYSPDPAFPNYILRSPLEGFNIDANNGPQPISCDVYQLVNDKTFHVHYVIKTWLLECPNGNEDALLSNRWSQTVSLNFQRLLVRKTVGQAYFRTDILDLGGFADLFRNQVIAANPPQPGLFREAMNFVVTPQGNALHYEIIDVERQYNLSNTIGNKTYIVKADGYFSQGTMANDGNGAGAAIGCAAVTMVVQLWGSAEANNWTLTQIAFAVINQQIPLADISPANNVLLLECNIMQSIIENYVEVKVSAQIMLAGEQIKPALPFDSKYLRTVNPVNNYFDPGRNGTNPGFQNFEGSMGSDPVFLRSSLLLNACVPQDIPDPNQQIDSPGQQNEYGNPPNIQIFEIDVLPPIQSDYLPNTQPYTRASTESQYQYDSGTLQAPIANPNNPKSSSSSDSGSSGQDAIGPYQSEILNFYAPVQTLHVDWKVERVGLPPNIPHFIKSIQCLQNNQQAVIKTAIVKPYSVTTSNDLLNPIFSVTGSYDYYIPFANDPTNPPLIVFDVPQNINANYGEQYIQGDNSGNCGSGNFFGDYVHGIIDTAQGSSDQGSQGGGGN